MWWVGSQLEPRQFSFRSMTRVSAAQVNLTFNAVPSDILHRLEATSDFVHWSIVDEQYWDPSSATVSFTDSSAPSGGARFYRVRLVP